MNELNNKASNILSGFKKKVIKKLPDAKPHQEYKVNHALLDHLKENRAPDPMKKVRSKKYLGTYTENIKES